jgi:hypothetical protein
LPAVNGLWQASAIKFTKIKNWSIAIKIAT